MRRSTPSSRGKARPAVAFGGVSVLDARVRAAFHQRRHGAPVAGFGRHVKGGVSVDVAGADEVTARGP